MPAAERANPRETLSYLRKHPSSEAPGWITRADALDAQLLVIASSWDLWRTERHHLRSGRSDGMYHDDLGGALGLGPGSHARAEDDARPPRRRRTGRGDPHQPARWRLATLTDLLRFDEPGIALARPARRAASVDPADPRWAWLTEHCDQIATVTDGLITAADRYQVISVRAWQDELAADIAEAALSPATLALLGLVVGEVRTARAVVELTSTHAVHRALLAADRLRCKFSGISCHAHGRWAPPPPNIADLVREIASRRERMDDPQRDRLPSPDAAEPADVLAFLRRYPSANSGVRQFDHLAALTLINALWWQDRDYELWALRAGLRSGVFRTQLGAPHGITTAQGFKDRADRLESLTTRGKPDEKHVRDLRHTDTAPIHREQDWVEANQETLHRLAAELLTAAETLGVDDESRDWLDLLAAHHTARNYGTTALVTFACAAGEVHVALGRLPVNDHPHIKDLLNVIDSIPTVKRNRLATQSDQL